MRHQGPVLVDTNVIFESHRVGALSALTGGYSIETVEDCVMETQTGRHNRTRACQIDEIELRSKLAAVHSVSKAKRANARIRVEDIEIDTGELSLWAYAIGCCDDWKFCGPDFASIRFGVRLGFGDHIMSLEKLLNDVGFRGKTPLREHYNQNWLENALTRCQLDN